MKNIIKYLLTIFILSLPLFVDGSDNIKNEPSKVFSFDVDKIKILKDTLETTPLKPLQKPFKMFIDSIAFMESSDRYDIVNRFGYKGRYQLGKMVLKDLEISNRKDFLSNKKLQDTAFISLLRINKYRLRKEIKKYVGKYVDSIYITESGILSASHLVGSKSVKKFLTQNINTKDGNGISLKYYLKKFSNYKIPLTAKRKISLKSIQYKYDRKDIIPLKTK